MACPEFIILVKELTANYLALITVSDLVTKPAEASEVEDADVIVDNSTFGYYNDALGTTLDGTQLQFPPANVSGGDPTIKSAPEPDLTTVASTLGNWLSADPHPLSTNWSGLRDIPKKWKINDETAIIYPIDTGAQGIAKLTGNFGVDNGIFVWVNGEYRFGAIEPGGLQGIEYTDIDLGSLPPGLNYLQILLEDHGGSTGFTISITGTVGRVSGQINSPTENITIGPSTLLFSADTWTNGGASIEQVEFIVFYDGVWHAAGIDSNPPYEVTWQTPNILRSQQLKFAIHIVDEWNNKLELADVVYGVNYLESLGNPDVGENWIPTRAYLNQRSLEPNGDSKCSAASMAMMLAMNSITDWDYATMRNKANEMYPRVLNANGAAILPLMVEELKQQGLEAETRKFLRNDAWQFIIEEVDAGRPVIVRTEHGVVTSGGHFFVAVGYREAVGSRQVIAYDPFGRWLGTCCSNNYDINVRDASSRKGQWVSYDFDLAFGFENWLITTARPATNGVNLARTTNTPTTSPDLVSEEPVDIGTYLGVEILVEEKLFLPSVLFRQ